MTYNMMKCKLIRGGTHFFSDPGGLLDFEEVEQDVKKIWIDIIRFNYITERGKEKENDIHVTCM